MTTDVAEMMATPRVFKLLKRDSSFFATSATTFAASVRASADGMPLLALASSVVVEGSSIGRPYPLNDHN